MNSGETCCYVKKRDAPHEYRLLDTRLHRKTSCEEIEIEHWRRATPRIDQGSTPG